MKNKPMLYLICGKIAAGKSTLAAQLSLNSDTVLLSEDHWTSKLYPNQIHSLPDYVRCSRQLQDAIGPHIISLLKEGMSVVMDFPANTVAQREWLRGLYEAANVDHELHFIDVSDDICKKRLHERNANGDHAYQVSDDQFDLITSYFILPTKEEGFKVIVH